MGPRRAVGRGEQHGSPGMPRRQCRCGASVGTVTAAMVGVHTLIGIGEGIITALTVGVVLGVRPDLVHGAADLQAPLVLEAREVA